MSGQCPSRQITWQNFQAVDSFILQKYKNTGYPPKQSGLDISLKAGKIIVSVLNLTKIQILLDYIKLVATNT